MTHEETADLLRSARAKILRNSIFPQEEQPKLNFAKILAESYPFRGWPQKQAVVYTSDIKREWCGATEGRNKHHGCPVRRCGILATRLLSASPASGPTSCLAWSRLLHADEHPLPTSHFCWSAVSVRRSHYHLQTVRKHRIKYGASDTGFRQPTAGARRLSRWYSPGTSPSASAPSERSEPASSAKPSPSEITRRQDPSNSRTECRRARHSDPAKRNALPQPRPAP